jgi:hypothetical protein
MGIIQDWLDIQPREYARREAIITDVSILADWPRQYTIEFIQAFAEEATLSFIEAGLRLSNILMEYDL